LPSSSSPSRLCATPLASIGAGAKLLRKMPLNDRASGIVAMMLSRVVRMSGLIDNVLDFARGRLAPAAPAAAG
jgi:signal transduction histidine kinase